MKLKKVFLIFSIFLLKERLSVWFWSYFLPSDKLAAACCYYHWESHKLPLVFLAPSCCLKAFWKRDILSSTQIPDGGWHYEIRVYGNYSVWAQGPELNHLPAEIMECPMKQIPACKWHSGKAVVVEPHWTEVLSPCGSSPWPLRALPIKEAYVDVFHKSCLGGGSQTCIRWRGCSCPLTE